MWPTLENIDIPAHNHTAHTRGSYVTEFRKLYKHEAANLPLVYVDEDKTYEYEIALQELMRYTDIIDHNLERLYALWGNGIEQLIEIVTHTQEQHALREQAWLHGPQFICGLETVYSYTRALKTAVLYNSTIISWPASGEGTCHQRTVDRASAVMQRSVGESLDRPFPISVDLDEAFDTSSSSSASEHSGSPRTPSSFRAFYPDLVEDEDVPSHPEWHTYTPEPPSPPQLHLTILEHPPMNFPPPTPLEENNTLVLGSLHESLASSEGAPLPPLLKGKGVMRSEKRSWGAHLGSHASYMPGSSGTRKGIPTEIERTQDPREDAPDLLERPSKRPRFKEQNQRTMI